MINPFVNNGTLFYISATLPVTYDSAGYAAVTWTRVRGVRSTGDMGETWQTFDSNAIGGIRHNKRTGKAANTVALEMIKIDDAGQTLLKAASESENSYSYKCLAVDNTAYYFTAGCSGRTNNAGESASIADIKITLELDSALLEV